MFRSSKLRASWCIVLIIALLVNVYQIAEANQATPDFGPVDADLFDGGVNNNQSGYNDLQVLDVKEYCAYEYLIGVRCKTYTLQNYSGLIETFSEYLHYLWSKGALDAKNRWYKILGYNPGSMDAGELTRYNAADSIYTASSYYEFKPKDLMTKEEFFAILAKAFGLTPNNTESPYPDYRNSSFAKTNFAEWFAGYPEDLIEVQWQAGEGYFGAFVRILALIDGESRPFWRAIFIKNGVSAGVYKLRLPARTKAVSLITCCSQTDSAIISVKTSSGSIISFPYVNKVKFYSAGDPTYYSWVRAAMAAGWATGDTNGLFSPQRPIKKIDIIVPLIKALGYEQIADNMPQSEVDAILSRFSDGNSVPADSKLRKGVALLVKNNLLLYDTIYNPPMLNLNKQLTRVEGATMIALALMHRSESTFAATAIPNRISAGHPLTIVAFSPKGASEVVANVPTGTNSWDTFNLEYATVLPINDENLEQWNSIWVVPQNLSTGQYSISLIAKYPDGKVRRATVDIEVIESAPSTINFNDVCAFLSDPAWAEPGKSVTLGCKKPASSSYAIDSGFVTIDNLGTYQLNRGSDGGWYTQITVPNRESLYRVVYSLNVKSQNNAQTRSVTGEQTLIVTAPGGYCSPPAGLDTSLSPGYGKVRLFR